MCRSRSCSSWGRSCASQLSYGARGAEPADAMIRQPSVLRDGASRLLRVWPEMGHAGSVSCESAGEQSHVGEEEPCGSAGDGGFEVLGQASAAPEPGEGTLDHPAPRQQLEAFDARWALDNLDRPRAAIGDGGLQLRAKIDTVGEDMRQVGEAFA